MSSCESRKKEVRITEVDLRVIQLDSTNRSVGLHADPEGHLVSCRTMQ
ncbi:hypothetical protein COMA1_10347 [Candidatus Nitrospira nitrosa]|uniref:Uncharacterized protein n=1 Tax=Candidatus Nitrospira nitrosa TaxID=1742972 RepID=A0A0S4LA09_9BACT|nr:hypothetical protein COMA1_10347 [Candidatus Nitrospira nitrosa]